MFWAMCHHSLGHEKKALLILPKAANIKVFSFQEFKVARG